MPVARPNLACFCSKLLYGNNRELTLEIDGFGEVEAIVPSEPHVLMHRTR